MSAEFLVRVPSRGRHFRGARFAFQMILSALVIGFSLATPTARARLGELGSQPQRLPTREILSQTNLTPPHRWTWLGRQVSRDFAWQPNSPHFIGEVRREFDDVELSVDDPQRLESVQVYAFGYDDTRSRQRELERAHRELSQSRMEKLGLRTQDVQRRDRISTRNSAMQLVREDQFTWGSTPWVHVEQSVMVGSRIVVFSMSGPANRREEIQRLLKELAEQSQIDP